VVAYKLQLAMSEKTIKLFKLPNGKEPFNLWLKKVKDKTDVMRIRRRIDRLSLGHYGDVKSIAHDLYELRFHFSSGYRVYFTEYMDEIIILLLGGNKKSQAKDIEAAKGYLDLICGEIQDE